jgi:L-ornithine N5-oxygenase
MSIAVEHDFIGIGFGPSNLALAIMMEELASVRHAAANYCFIEKKPEFVWHGSMLLPGSDMQISFLKDLATLRNPQSRYTFINYLQQKGRLKDFINLKTFFPSRVEFNDYLAWVAAHFEERCRYAEEVVGVEPVFEGDEVARLNVISRDESGQAYTRVARNLVLGVGGVPCLPRPFETVTDARVFHSARYLERVAELQRLGRPLRRVAVIGGGQSAAEVFMDLVHRLPGAEVALITRGEALKPSDDSPFVNEIFNPQFTDLVYQQPKVRRSEMLARYRNTNYSVVDADLIEAIYELFYMQKVEGHAPHRLLTCRTITEVDAADDGITLEVRNHDRGGAEREQFDAVVLATGYRRDDHRRLLEALAPWTGDYEVARDYRLLTSPGFAPRIYLQGCCEDSHGLSDTLLSVLAVRAEEIAASLYGISASASRAPDRIEKVST